MVRALVDGMGVGDRDAQRILDDLVAEHAITASDTADGRPDVTPGPRWEIEPSRAGYTVGIGDESVLTEELIRRAAEARATDLHIAPDGRGNYAVQFRIDGRLEPYCPLHLDVATPLLRQYRLMAAVDINEPFRPHEGRLRLPPTLAGIEARMTSMPVAGGEAVALRLQVIDRLMQPLDRLGINGQARSVIERILTHGAGLVLVTGPTGSGKTTTVYSLLKLLDNGQRHIVSIEDPVEYCVPFIRQTEVNPRHDVTMTTGLRTLLRMDPDVMFVGEIRDVEAAEIALRAATTGRYVLSTLHTHDVASTVTALRDFRGENRTIAGNLAGVINQRLVRRLCADCRVEAPPDENACQMFQAEGLEPPAIVGRAVGCSHCRGTGFRNRIGVFEAVVIEDQIKEAIERGASEDELRRLIRSAGTPSLLAEVLKHAGEGITAVEESRSILWV
jgi:general secretion pathway protein E